MWRQEGFAGLFEKACATIKFLRVLAGVSGALTIDLFVC
jgi:hypothetical protein